MEMESKRKNALVLVVIALFFAACREDGSSSSNSGGSGNQPVATVAVGVASGTAFQGLDEVRDPETGAVIEDSLTYISMENDQEIVLRVTMAQSTEIYQRLLFRTNAPSIFRLGTQSPANADVVELRPGQTTEVHIRSLYNNAEEPRMQTDTMRVIGLNAENEETILREFRIGSYKKVVADLLFLRMKRNGTDSFTVMSGDDWVLFKKNANIVLNPAIVEVDNVDFNERIVDYDANNNGSLDMYSGAEENGREYGEMSRALADLAGHNTSNSPFQISLAYARKMDIFYKVSEKVGAKTLKALVAENVSIVEGTTYYFAPDEMILGLLPDQAEILTVTAFERQKPPNYSTIEFAEDIKAEDVSGYVLLAARSYTLGGAALLDPQYTDLNYVIDQPIILNAEKLADNEREMKFVPIHELSHVFGLRDVVATEEGNLMTCYTDYWGDTPIPFLRGRPVMSSLTATPGCPPDEDAGYRSQWDTWIREPQWVR